MVVCVGKETAREILGNIFKRENVFLCDGLIFYRQARKIVFPVESYLALRVHVEKMIFYSAENISDFISSCEALSQISFY